MLFVLAPAFFIFNGWPKLSHLFSRFICCSTPAWAHVQRVGLEVGKKGE
ncbi:UNVERIFIED_ORG: hypothetical protein BDK47_11426 [Anoxybacillus amylolyticus]|uniref:Uncharacterized protein n=1 Tax=Geobacillus kaustophilus GBlys TaxID=1337888 RepID=U2WSU0_GEOKU|nr:hypothetical protein GBL_2028 [Geobacillus kaustophilus GBlys]